MRWLGRSMAIGGVLLGAVAAYRRQRTWGASSDEASRVLPSDELISDATQNTRAITVDAPPDAVWPWIAQLGGDRGGFYSYDWLEDHFGFFMGGPADLGIHSADRIVPGWQDRSVGDLVASDASGFGGWYVASIEPGRSMVLQMADVKRGEPTRRDEPPYTEFTWAFVLDERRAGTTRLIVRERVGIGNPLMRVAALPIGLVSFMMTRKMLIGIKQRAEGMTPILRQPVGVEEP
jgi:hypothetical protein